MDASIDFSGVLRGSIADGGGGGGGDSVIITPVVTSGTKIADVSVNGVEKDLYCPTMTPTQVIVTQEQQSGTKIGSIEVNGVEVDLYAPNPTEVSVTQVQQSGTKIATIEVNGQNTDLYAPNSGSHEYSTSEHVVGVWVDGKPVYEKTFNLSVNISTTNRTWYTILSDADIQSHNMDKIFIDQVGSYAIDPDDGTLYPIPYSSVMDSVGALIGFSVTEGAVKICVGNISTGSMLGSLTLRYTKTTDTPTRELLLLDLR